MRACTYSTFRIFGRDLHVTYFRAFNGVFKLAYVEIVSYFLHLVLFSVPSVCLHVYATQCAL